MDFKTYKKSIENEKINTGSNQYSNPLEEKRGMDSVAITDYSQELPRPNFDRDITNILEVVKILNNIAPIRMPIYNFNLEEINGDYYYKPDGSLLLVREYDSDIIRDYYASEPDEEGNTVSRILEHDKKNGRLRTKIEPILRKGSKLKTNITIFDMKVNNKYILIQLSEEGYVNNISEFTGKGKSFQTLFRNINTFKPARYLEGKDNPELGFEMVDCIFDQDGKIARIKHYSNKKETIIEYTDKVKNIKVRTKA